MPSATPALKEVTGCFSKVLINYGGSALVTQNEGTNGT